MKATLLLENWVLEENTNMLGATKSFSVECGVSGEML